MPIKIGVGGPVGCGKTKLLEVLCRAWKDRYAIGVVTNDIYTTEDAEQLKRVGALAEDRILGVETGGCPHTAIRDDITPNLDAIDVLCRRFERLDLIFIESGGDNLSAMFSPELVDLSVYMIDVSGGDDIPRKGGKGLMQSDLLLINKVDLAPYVGADLSVMETDTLKARAGRPFIFTDLKRDKGVGEVLDWLSQKISEQQGNRARDA